MSKKKNISVQWAKSDHKINLAYAARRFVFLQSLFQTFHGWGGVQLSLHLSACAEVESSAFSCVVTETPPLALTCFQQTPAEEHEQKEHEPVRTVKVPVRRSRSHDLPFPSNAHRPCLSWPYRGVIMSCASVLILVSALYNSDWTVDESFSPLYTHLPYKI